MAAQGLGQDCREARDVLRRDEQAGALAGVVGVGVVGLGLGLPGLEVGAALAGAEVEQEPVGEGDLGGGPAARGRAQIDAGAPIPRLAYFGKSIYPN